MNILNAAQDSLEPYGKWMDDEGNAPSLENAARWVNLNEYHPDEHLRLLFALTLHTLYTDQLRARS